jgi:hypothetical protein
LPCVASGRQIPQLKIVTKVPRSHPVPPFGVEEGVARQVRFKVVDPPLAESAEKTARGFADRRGLIREAPSTH